MPDTPMTTVTAMTRDSGHCSILCKSGPSSVATQDQDITEEEPENQENLENSLVHMEDDLPEITFTLNRMNADYYDSKNKAASVSGGDTLVHVYEDETVFPRTREAPERQPLFFMNGDHRLKMNVGRRPFVAKVVFPYAVSEKPQVRPTRQARPRVVRRSSFCHKPSSTRKVFSGRK